MANKKNWVGPTILVGSNTLTGVQGLTGPVGPVGTSGPLGATPWLKKFLPTGTHHVYHDEAQALLVAKLKPNWKLYDPKWHEDDTTGFWTELGIYVFIEEHTTPAVHCKDDETQTSGSGDTNV